MSSGTMVRVQEWGSGLHTADNVSCGREGRGGEGVSSPGPPAENEPPPPMRYCRTVITTEPLTSLQPPGASNPSMQWVTGPATNCLHTCSTATSHCSETMLSVQKDVLPSALHVSFCLLRKQHTHIMQGDDNRVPCFAFRPVDAFSPDLVSSAYAITAL